MVDESAAGAARTSAMTRVAASATRDDSFAESFHTFGRASSINQTMMDMTKGNQQRRPSICSDSDEWSYTLSAYGADDERSSIRYANSSRRPSGSPATLDIPDAIPFIFPHLKYIPPRQASPASMPSSSSELFTPDYSVATLPRPSISSTFSFSDSPISYQNFSTTAVMMPPSPRYPPRYKEHGQQDESGLGIELKPSASPASYLTIHTRFAPEPPPPQEQHQDDPITPLRVRPLPQQPSAPVYFPPQAMLEKPRRHMIQQRTQSDRLEVTQTRFSTSSSSTSSTQSLPEHIRHALKSVDRSTNIILSVDQEGTREVQTTLKYMRIHKPQVFRDKEIKALESAALWCETPSRPEPFQQSGCIEFGMDPKARAKWSFHHAAFEGLPVLRRLTVRGDDRHDYLSRGASLQIRDTGVYAIYGNEDKGRVEWKFEYLVQPRISSATGGVVINEKIVIPLGFYVSPNFFNQDRALKLHLLNVFKKNLTPNIISEKVKPPHVGTPPSASSGQTPPPPPKHTDSSSSSSSRRGSIAGDFGENIGGGPSVGSRTRSRTFEAIAKAVGGTRSATTTPTSSNHPPPFGSKGPNSSSRPGSRAKTPTNPIPNDPSNQPNSSADTPMEPKGKKKLFRRRATSLFGRSRPFTPPVNINETDPVPALRPMKSNKSLSARRPHTSQCPTITPPPVPNKPITPMRSIKDIDFDPSPDGRRGGGGGRSRPHTVENTSTYSCMPSSNSSEFKIPRKPLTSMKSLGSLSSRPRTADPSAPNVPPLPQHNHRNVSHHTIKPTSRPSTANTIVPTSPLSPKSISIKGLHGLNNTLVNTRAVMISRNEQMAIWQARRGFSAGGLGGEHIERGGGGQWSGPGSAESDESLNIPRFGRPPGGLSPPPRGKSRQQLSTADSRVASRW